MQAARHALGTKEEGTKAKSYTQHLGTTKTIKKIKVWNYIPCTYTLRARLVILITYFWQFTY